ncbi:MAG TPA: glycosyltransferase family 2 protein [Armatimonadota bacterium]|nr:glycosyltransferase family 2 protein [Armatimonadota bacterium]
MKLSVIVPAYNEVDTMEESIARVRQVKLDQEIIVVDDCSTDGTRELLQQLPDIKLVLHERNMGKGMAIRTALGYVTGDIVIIQDADLEYDPRDFPAMVEPIASGKADVVYGSRFLKSTPKMRLPNYIANRGLAITASILFRTRITDEATCYKAFRADLIKSLNLTCRRFEFCPEVTAKLLRRGVKIMEVPIRYTARTSELGKKIGWWDGIVAFWTLIKYRFMR